MRKDLLKISNKKLKSRLIVGTGKYKSFKETAKAIVASGADKTAINVATSLYNKGYNNCIMVVGSDRVKEFNDLMIKSSDDMIKLTSLIEDSEDIRATLTQMMWSNCKACHSRFRAPH